MQRPDVFDTSWKRLVCLYLVNYGIIFAIIKEYFLCLNTNVNCFRAMSDILRVTLKRIHVILFTMLYDAANYSYTCWSIYLVVKCQCFNLHKIIRTGRLYQYKLRYKGNSLQVMFPQNFTFSQINSIHSRRRTHHGISVDRLKDIWHWLLRSACWWTLLLRKPRNQGSSFPTIM